MTKQELITRYEMYLQLDVCSLEKFKKEHRFDVVSLIQNEIRYYEKFLNDLKGLD